MSQTTDEQPPTDAPPPDPAPAAGGRPRTAPLDQLRRSRTDRKIAGVAGGLARHLDIDPTIVRVLLVVACLFGGSGFLLYVAAWLLLPDDDGGAAPLSLSASVRTALLVGAVALAGLLVLGISWGGVGFPWPLVVLGLAVAVYLSFRDRQPSQAAWRPPTAGAPAVVPAEDPATAPPAVPKRPRRGGPLLFGPTLAVLAIALGALGLYDGSGGQVTATAYPALAVAVVGLALLLAACVGRGGGLVLLGVLAAGALATTTAISTVGGLADTGRQVSATPIDAASVRSTYDVPTGRIVLDLSRVHDPRRLVGRTIDIGTRAGELVVVLPSKITTFVDATIGGAGQIDLPDRLAGGVNPSYEGYYGNAPGAEPGTGLTLNLHAFAGHIDVRTSR